MRLPKIALAAALAAGAVCSSAAAQPRPYDNVSGRDAVQPQASPEDPAFTASTVAADLSGLNLRIEQEEKVMTRLRNEELARQRASLAAIRPALPFRGDDWFPRRY